MSLMSVKAAIATNDFYSCFEEVLPQLNLFNSPEFTDEYDIIIFSGGEDINPNIYGEKKTSHCGHINTQRDAIELQLLNAIFNAKTVKTKIVFGVCRGIQMLNAFFGGTLHQDLASLSHAGTHKITWEKNIGALSNLQLTNSMHHQGIKIPAKNLQVLAKEPETGVIEMAQFLHPEMRVFATQFHPELFRYEDSIWFFEELMKLGIHNDSTKI